MTQQLPERANLEQLRKQAKTLLHAARNQEPAALDRFQAFLASATPSDPGSLALHNAQFVLAREYGFKSWNEMREHVEERSLSFDAAVDEFVRCATGDASARALRLLELHPGIAHANLHTELVLGDADAVATRLKTRPENAQQSGGPQNWEPLLYVCHTCLHRDSPDRAAGLVKIAQELLRRARRWIILDLILILSPAAKTLSWSNGQRRGYNYRLAAPAIIQKVNKPAIIRT